MAETCEVCFLSNRETPMRRDMPKLIFQIWCLRIVARGDTAIHALPWSLLLVVATFWIANTGAHLPQVKLPIHQPSCKLIALEFIEEPHKLYTAMRSGT